MNLYAQALDVQDACNLQALARLLVKATDAAAKDGTEASYRDPAVVLIVNKIESLVRSTDGLNFSRAYDICAQAKESSNAGN